MNIFVGKQLQWIFLSQWPNIVDFLFYLRQIEFLKLLESFVAPHIDFLGLEQELRKVQPIFEWFFHRWKQLKSKIVDLLVCPKLYACGGHNKKQKNCAKTIHNLDIGGLCFHWSQLIEFIQDMILGSCWFYWKLIRLFHFDIFSLIWTCSRYLILSLCLFEISDSDHPNWNSIVYRRQYGFRYNLFGSTHFLFRYFFVWLEQLVVGQYKFIGYFCGIKVQDQLFVCYSIFLYLLDIDPKDIFHFEFVHVTWIILIPIDKASGDKQLFWALLADPDYCFCVAFVENITQVFMVLLSWLFNCLTSIFLDFKMIIFG